MITDHKRSGWLYGAWALGLLGISSLAAVPGGLVEAAGPTTNLPAQANMVSPQSLKQAQSKGDLNRSSPWTFYLTLPSKNAAGLSTYANAVSDPNSPLYQHFLTHSELMQQYGPNASVVRRISAYLRQHGFQVSETGQMLAVEGTAGQVDALFTTHLAKFQRHRHVFVAPNSAITIPSPLRAAVGISGLVVHTLMPRIPSSLKPALKMPLVRYAPAGTMRPTPPGNTHTSTQNGLTVTAQRISNGPRVPGMAVRYLVTVTQNGVPDQNAALEGVSGPIQGAASVVDSTLTNSAGQFVMDFSLSQAQAVSLQLTVIDTSTHATASVQLPTAVFQGPSAKTTTAASLFGPSASGTILAPWNPASNSVVSAVNGQSLEQQTALHGPASLAVYTAGNVASVSEQDVNAFAQKFGLTPPNVSVAYTGPNACTVATCGQPTMAAIEEEESLDMQMMETAAPGSNIQVYEAGSLRSALNQVVSQDTAKVFSISYGGGEDVEEAYAPGAQASWDLFAEEANIEGITISVSAGDSGAFEGTEYGDMTPQPSYPANSPYVSALGGTEASVNPDGQVNQIAMWGGNIGRELSTPELLSFLSMENMIAGGGYSTLEPRPSYQDQVVPPYLGRGNPDFSLPASVVTPGYFAYLGGQTYYVGGTSASAPLFAGFVGDLTLQVGHALGNVNPVVYQLAAKDPAVMSTASYGNNGVYSVTPGYNAATGLGEINVGALAQALSPRGPAPGPGPAPGRGPGPRR
ncbi:S53 family peptidase [Sulfobacillus harzensis]|uniref:S8/S53 family peptidase n=1 Tax=Sulfobacillus harzensis TaxID=2729629 RepID=A0A7Y0Q412_9FIRM|nr:S53 family peptidase [Sulfobacillus harzensis]NMP23536.1 S8/S53 family peptidase [Sulfobacillus harzensis]